MKGEQITKYSTIYDQSYILLWKYSKAIRDDTFTNCFKKAIEDVWKIF